MSPQEQMICKMADEIRAGRLLVTGDMSVHDAPAWGRPTDLDSKDSGLPPLFESFTMSAELDCRKIKP